MNVLRQSFEGHGWVVWASGLGTVGAVAAGQVGLAMSLLAVELVVLVDLIRWHRRQGQGQRQHD